MHRSWRHQIREAQEAFTQGRLNDVCRLLQRGELNGYAPGKRLADLAVRKLIERASRLLENGDVRAAWIDCELAATFGQCSVEIDSLRKALLYRFVQDVERYLNNSELKDAQSLLEFLGKYQVNDERIGALRKATDCFQQAHQLSEQGDFTQAEEQYGAVGSLVPHLVIIDQLRNDCRDNLVLSRKLKDQLQMALLGDDWDKIVEIADRLLELSPGLSLAQDARERAWEKSESLVGNAPSKNTSLSDETHYWESDRRENNDIANRFDVESSEQFSRNDTVIMNSRAPRFLLWVDAVGGYLVCLANEVVVGQALPDSAVDIPILGDLSREHARIRRDKEDYLIEPIAEVRLRGNTIQSTTMLTDGDEIELGGGVLFRFRKPHALSATVRLELISRHRTQPWADGVLLMAESCVLGPNHTNHVVCRDWNEDVVLFQQGDELYCRGMESLEIDGNNCDGIGLVSFNSRIIGSDFSMSLEAI